MSVSESAAAGRTEAGLSGQNIIREIKASGIQFVISVPDITTSEGLLRPLAKLSDPRLIRICKEDEGVGICAGLSFTGKRAAAADPADRPARLHQRHPRQRGRISACRSA